MEPAIFRVENPSVAMGRRSCNHLSGVPRMSWVEAGRHGRCCWQKIILMFDQTVKLANDEVNIRLGRTAIIVRR